MAIRVYIMPIESATVDGMVYQGPKYLRSRNRPAPDAELQSVSYGALPVIHRYRIAQSWLSAPSFFRAAIDDGKMAELEIKRRKPLMERLRVA